MMKWTIAFATVLFVQTSAFAFPPTATVSPGYDRALAESRKARQFEPPMIAPAPRVVKPKMKQRHFNRH